MITTVDEAIKRLEAGFWRRYNARPELQDKLRGKNRTLQLILTDKTEENHWFQVVDGKLAHTERGTHEKPDAIVTTVTTDLFALFNGELKPVQAYLTKRIKVKASFTDLLFAKSLFGL